MIYTNWDRLEEVIVGSSYGAGDIDHLLDDRIKDKFNLILQETKEDLDSLARHLESLGVKVYRPEVNIFPEEVRFPKFDISIPTAPIVPRDQYFVYGNTILQTYTSMPDRYLDSINYRTIFQQLFDRGYNWISQPPPVLKNLNHDEKWWLCGDRIYKELESELLWHTATMFRCGEHIIVNSNGPGNTRGLEWLKRNLSEATFVDNTGSYMNNFGHIDHGMFMTDDNLIFCIDKRWVPIPLRNRCEVVEIKEFLGNFNFDLFSKEYVQSQGKFTVEWMDRWLTQWKGYMQEVNFDTNVLVIDSHNVMFNAEQPKLFKFLETFGINCHVAKQRHGFFWEAGVHCLTLDLARTGKKRSII